MPAPPAMIRAATPDDRAAIAALHLASWRSSYGAELSQDYLRDILPDEMAAKWADRSFAWPQVTLVAERDGTMAGFACALADRDVPLIDNLHVRPGLRGGGLGAALLAAMRATLAEAGFARATLTVLQSNPRALAFYLAQGGVEEGPVREMLVGHPVSAHRIGFTL